MMKKQIKNWSLMILMAILLPLVTSCSDNKEVYAIEDALQLEWDISNSQSPVGAVECNVFKVKIDKEEGNSNNKMQPDLQTLEEIAKVLGIDKRDLLTPTMQSKI